MPDSPDLTVSTETLVDPPRGPYPCSRGHSDRDSSPGSPGARRRAQIFREAAALIASDPAAELSLEDVARRIATSSRQLQRAFSENAPVGFRAYLCQLRLARAEELLRTGSTPISQVGEAVGYQGFGAFSKAFRRMYGVAPSEYRAASSREAEGR